MRIPIRSGTWSRAMRRAVNLHAKVYFTENGEAYLIAGTLRDITDHKNAEKGLEDQVSRRTEELNKANYHLSRSNQELEQFAFIASHDLQEPSQDPHLLRLLEEKSKGGLNEEGLRYLPRSGLPRNAWTGSSGTCWNFPG